MAERIIIEQKVMPRPRPKYDLEAMKQEVVKIDGNIEHLNNEIQKQVKYKLELQGYIAEQENEGK